MRRFDATPRRATPKGHKTFISHAAAQSVKVSYLHRGLSLLRTWRTDDPGLARMQQQPDRVHPLPQSRQDTLRLGLADAVDHRVIHVALEPDGRELPGQPGIERVVQEQIGD